MGRGCHKEWCRLLLGVKEGWQAAVGKPRRLERRGEDARVCGGILGRAESMERKVEKGKMEERRGTVNGERECINKRRDKEVSPEPHPYPREGARLATPLPSTSPAVGSPSVADTSLDRG